MTDLTTYFQNKAYKPKYHLGDRVFGYWQKIPFIGTVGVDRILNESQGPHVVVILDLPIITKNKKINRIVTVKHKDIKPLVKF